MKRSTAAALALLLLTPATWSAAATSSPVKFQSSEKSVALMELYTSEGCSSCPPAETWLSGLKQHADLWRTFVPVVYHVDYWDHLGWPDPLAKPAFTVRQRAWANLWRERTVYTPGFIWQGAEWQSWREGLPAAPSSAPVGILIATVEGDQITVSFSQPGDWDIHAARLGFDLTVKVKAGENVGRTLVHDFAVLSQASAPAASFPRSLTLPSSSVAARQAVAVWVTRHGSLVPVQATGGWLSSPRQP